MDDVINYIKAINGCIFGGYVRDKLAGMDNTSHPIKPQDLDCRIPKDQLSYLISILIVGNYVIENIVGENYRRMDITSYTISPRLTMRREVPVANNVDVSSSFKMDVLCTTDEKWHHYPCDFDVNMLVENNEALYIRPHVYSALWSVPNKIDHVMNRCKTRTFGMIAFPQDTFDDIWVLLLRSKDLVERGWTMDDYYLATGSWVFSQWKNIRHHPTKMRPNANGTNIESMKNQTVCSICHETFKDDDIVMNTCCNHNFHWECHQRHQGDNTTGIGQWFKVKQAYPCPVCRQDAVRHLRVCVNLPRLLSLATERVSGLV